VLELARLKHPGLPEIVDSFIMKDSTTNQTCYYVVRDFIEGKDLVSLMEARGGASFPVDEALDYFKQMLEIFNYLHNRVPPVFFRNVSPSSFMIEKNRVHCVDFGISQVLMDSQRKLVISGFASQEQEKTTSGVDRNLTAIAAATHFLLTGMTPEESCRQSLRRINPNVPEHFDRLIMSMVDYMAPDRPQSVDDVLTRLNSPLNVPLEICTTSAEGMPEITTIFYLIEKNNIGGVKELIAQGADVNQQESSGDTPVLRALFEGHEEIVLMLMEAGADVSIIESIGSTPMHWAVAMDMMNVTSLLVEKGADIARGDNTGITPLHIAASRDRASMTDYLIEKGAFIDVKDQNECTPLHNAAMQGSWNAARILIQRGADLKAKDRNGNTPLHRAAYLLDWTLQKNHHRVGEFLIQKGAPLDECNELGRTPLHEAAQSNNLEFARLLLNNGASTGMKDIDGQTALMEAVLNNHYDVAHLLIEKGAEVNEPDGKGNTPLHWASYKGFIRLVELLVDNGADINREDVNGDNPLFLAEQARRMDISGYLMSKGARHNIRSRVMKKIYGSHHGPGSGRQGSSSTPRQ
jgi:ankyrin repeat protein